MQTQRTEELRLELLNKYYKRKQQCKILSTLHQLGLGVLNKLESSLHTYYMKHNRLETQQEYVQERLSVAPNELRDGRGWRWQARP